MKQSDKEIINICLPEGGETLRRAGDRRAVREGTTMKELIRRSAAFIAALSMTAVLASCSTGKTSEEQVSGNMVGSPTPGQAVQEDDMPYGSTVATLTPTDDNGLHIPIEYDKRFFTEEEATMVSNFLYAIGTGDSAPVEGVFYPAVMNYYCEMTKTDDPKAYFKGLHDNYNSILGEGYEFTKVYIENCFKDQDTGTESGQAFADVNTMLNELEEDENFAENKVEKESMRYMYIEATYTLPGSEEQKSFRNAIFSVDSESQYLPMLMYTIDGKPYLI